MKIIDNKKDYYDYVSGLWGIDDKIILDRRKFKTVSLYDRSYYKDAFKGSKDYIYRIWYGSKFKEIYYKDGWQMTDKPSEGLELHRQTTTDPLIQVVVYNIMPKSRFWLWLTPPILCYEDIILKDFNIIKAMIPAEEIWQELYSFLSSKYDKGIIDNRTDIQKLESAGFDKKSSFRNIK